MNCVQCGTPMPGGGNIIVGIGLICSQDCCQIAQGHRKKYHAELLAEPLGDMPDALDTDAFCHFTEKLAIHFLEAIGETGRNELKEQNAVLIIPEILAQDFNEKLLPFIPHQYVSHAKYGARDISSFVASGSFMFRQPVPAEIVVKACKRAQLTV